MRINYYKILKISDTATTDEIKQAYLTIIEKWQQLQTQQSTEAKKRSDIMISYIKEAYHVLSNPETRAEYDTETTPPILSTTAAPLLASPSQTTMPKTIKKPLLIGVLVVLAIIISVLYIHFSSVENTTHTQKPIKIPPSKRSQETAKKDADPMETASNKITSNRQDNLIEAPEITKASTQAEISQSAKIDQPTLPENTKPEEAIVTESVMPSDKLQVELKMANNLKKQNANNQELKQMAKNIANDANKHNNMIINFNTQFLGAKASNQNITLNFMVIDGISNSEILLDSYMRERFMYDNEVCNPQKVNIAKGNIFTFAYYNSKNKLLASYYIDEQVCQSPKTNRIIKSPDESQLKAIELNSDQIPENSDKKDKTN